MSPSISIRLLGTQSDNRLIEFAGQGHERAFEALVLRYRRQLLSYCRRLLLTEERAEDALQQGLLRAWMALQSGAEVRDPKAWMYRIVHNAALNTLRESGYDYAELHETLSGAGAPEDDLDRRIAVREALAGLAALPEMQREALLRTAVEGQSHQVVAAELLITEGALRGLVYRARATLRAAATAVTPLPLITWAASSSGTRSPIIERFTELGAGAGASAGLGGLLLKGAAVAATAGVLVTGVGAVRLHTTHRHAGPGGTQADSVSRAAASAAAGRGTAAESGGSGSARGAVLTSSTPPARTGHRPSPSSSPKQIAFVPVQPQSNSPGHGGNGQGGRGPGSGTQSGSGSGSGSGDGHGGGGASGGGGSSSDGSHHGGSGVSGTSGGGSSGSGSDGSGGGGSSGSVTTGGGSSTSGGDAGSNSLSTAGHGSDGGTSTTTTTSGH
jgi:RNA polymerase sigma factor (sigma-70 family)